MARKPKKIPDGFREDAFTLTIEQLVEKYKSSSTTVSLWREEVLNGLYCRYTVGVLCERQTDELCAGCGHNPAEAARRADRLRRGLKAI